MTVHHGGKTGKAAKTLATKKSSKTANRKQELLLHPIKQGFIKKHPSNKTQTA